MLPNLQFEYEFYEPLLLEHLANELGTPEERHIVTASRAMQPSNSRSPIALYDLGGLACVMSGQLTLFVGDGGEDVEDDYPFEAAVGECLVIPSDIPVSFVNFGELDAEFFTYSVILVPEGKNFSDIEVSISGMRICEMPESNNASWTQGPVPCDGECEELYNKSCRLYESCGHDSPATDNVEEPCLNECRINGEAVPMTTFDVPDREQDNPLGQSLNNGATIPMVPSWSVQEGFSGRLIDTLGRKILDYDEDGDRYFEK
ncbi:MAG: hypothetical protein SGARI_002763 [Bacillariaceae sp.]